MKIPEMEPGWVNPIIAELLGKDPAVTWILPGFIPEGVLFAVGGLSGAGKSYLMYTIGLALATGVPVLGMTPTRPTRVLYFDEENSNPDRVEYEKRAYIGLGKPNMHVLADNFLCCPFTLGGKDWAEHAETEILRWQPNLFVIDTTTPACNIVDENDNAEASQVIYKIRGQQNLTKPKSTAIVLKHSKYQTEGGGYTLRGAKAWEGAVDGTVYLAKGKGRPRGDSLSNTTLTPAKTRAFGLQNTLHIYPTWVEGRTGIKLSLASGYQEADPEYG